MNAIHSGQTSAINSIRQFGQKYSAYIPWGIAALSVTVAVAAIFPNPFSNAGVPQNQMSTGISSIQTLERLNNIQRKMSQIANGASLNNIEFRGYWGGMQALDTTHQDLLAHLMQDWQPAQALGITHVQVANVINRIKNMLPSFGDFSIDAFQAYELQNEKINTKRPQSLDIHSDFENLCGLDNHYMTITNRASKQAIHIREPIISLIQEIGLYGKGKYGLNLAQFIKVVTGEDPTPIIEEHLRKESLKTQPLSQNVTRMNFPFFQKNDL